MCELFAPLTYNFVLDFLCPVVLLDAVTNLSKTLFLYYIVLFYLVR